MATGGYPMGWLRSWAVRFAGAGLIVLIGTGSWALVKSVISSTHSTLLTPQSPSTSLSLSEKTRTKKIWRRCGALGIKPRFFNALVNEQFYAKHPEVRRRSLKNNPEDDNLRQEWYTSAEELLDQLQQAQLSAAARAKLGGYSQQNYEMWKGKANSGQMGGYTIDQLEKQTDERYRQLFPQQRGVKLKFQTFDQIWYAILSDKVSQLETRK
jgi:serine/threonine-protein kinase